VGTIHQCNIRDEENGTEGTQKQGGDTSALGFYNIPECKRKEHCSTFYLE